jgi:hypothetical protein
VARGHFQIPFGSSQFDPQMTNAISVDIFELLWSAYFKLGSVLGGGVELNQKYFGHGKRYIAMQIKFIQSQY